MAGLRNLFRNNRRLGLLWNGWQESRNLKQTVENSGATPYCLRVRQKVGSAARISPRRRGHCNNRQRRPDCGFQPSCRNPLSQTQRRTAMEKKPAAQNIQDTVLNTARQERSSITIYLMSGVKLTGRIRSFDKYSVVLETNNQEQLIFKHAISTVAVGRAHPYADKPRVVPTPTPGDTGEPPAASG